MVIREATVDDIPKLIPCAEEFHASSAHLRDFDPEHFVQSWTTYLYGGFGVIFVLETNDEIVGTIGALRHPDSNSGKMVVQECFWFTQKRYRGRGGLLYRALVEWSRGCELRMGYLVDSMPERMEEFYLKQGFRRVEVSYAKEVPA